MDQKVKKMAWYREKQVKSLINFYFVDPIHFKPAYTIAS